VVKVLLMETQIKFGNGGIMNIDRLTIENKIAELENAKQTKSVAEGKVFLANQDLKKAEEKVNSLTEMVNGLKLALAEKEYEETGCRIPSIHFQLFAEDCECKTTFHKKSAELYFSKAD